MGLELSEGEFTALVIVYGRGKAPATIAWKDFQKDVESVFTESNLEKKPGGWVPRH